MRRESPYYLLFTRNQASTWPGDRFWFRSVPLKVQFALVMLMTLVISLAGLGVMPIEGHEIFVVQSTAEMKARGDWVVPYYEQELRLKKPPLNYWLTGAVAKLSMDAQIQPWHARMVSAVGGCLMVGMILWCGVILGLPSLGVTAGLIAATSIAFLMFIHDGRPDMLYAGLCTAVFAFWLAAWRDDRPRRSALLIYAMWVSVALATLSKGPHIPFLFVALFVVISWLDNRFWRSCWKLFRPITGLALVAALTVPWWILLYLRVGDRLFESQLAGSRYGFSFWAFFNPYYFYRTFVVILPWCLLWLFAGLTLMEKSSRGRLARLMMILILGTLCALSLATGKRIVYVLPLLGPMSLLMALGASRLIDDARHNQPLGRFIRRFHTPVFVAVTLIAIAVTSVLHLQRLWTSETWWIPVACVLGCLVTGGVVMAIARQDTGREDWPFMVTLRGAAVIFAWFLLSSNLTGAAADPSRWMYQESSQAIKQTLSMAPSAHGVPIEPLYTLGINPSPFNYYLLRPVIELHNIKELEAVLHKTTGGLNLMVASRSLASLPATLTHQTTLLLFRDDGVDYKLLRVNLSAVSMSAVSSLDLLAQAQPFPQKNGGPPVTLPRE